MMATNYSKNQTVGGYRLVSLLGIGCSGEVWAAIDGRSGHLAALKLYRDRAAARQAEHEYSAARRFRHPRILRPVEMIVHEDCPVIVLPYCPGRSVDGVAGYMSELQIWHLLRDIAGALDELHENGMGHFDVKPSNILWDGSDFLLSDFGSCRAVSDAEDRQVADDESSFRFDAPEVSRGEQTVAGDIWSLGATVFCLYMGTFVFNGLGGRAQRPDSPIPCMRKSLVALSELVCRCLRYDPSLRPSAREIIEVAEMNIGRCMAEKPVRRPQFVSVRQGSSDGTGDYWPETMNDK